MTFKHLKFAESSTMQAFEKLAKEKGLVKPEPVVKKAEKKLDLSPSKSLVENILKLSAGLREQGFVRHAEDLERKFLVYKEAESLYETSKETGEDVVNQAHPDGSPSLEGVEGDAVVETIVDAKKKIEEIVNKKPTGKLTTAKDILNAVKMVFADEIAPTKTSFSFVSKYLLSNLNSALNLIKSSEDNRAVDILSSLKSLVYFVNGLTEATLGSEIDKVATTLNSIKEDLVKYTDTVKGDWTGDAKLNAERAMIYLEGAISGVSGIKRALTIESSGNKVPKFLRAVEQELAKVNKMGQMLETLDDENDKKVGRQWIEYFNKGLNELKNNRFLQNKDIADRMVDKLNPQLDKLKSEIAAFDAKL